MLVYRILFAELFPLPQRVYTRFSDLSTCKTKKECSFCSVTIDVRPKAKKL